MRFILLVPAETLLKHFCWNSCMFYMSRITMKVRNGWIWGW